MQTHAQLCALFAGAGFDEKGVDAVEFQRFRVHAAVRGASIADDDVHDFVNAGFLGAAKFGEDA